MEDTNPVGNIDRLGDRKSFLENCLFFLADDGLDFGDDDEEMEPSPKQAKINTTVSRICYWRKKNQKLWSDFLIFWSYQILGWKRKVGHKDRYIIGYYHSTNFSKKGNPF